MLLSLLRVPVCSRVSLCVVYSVVSCASCAVIPAPCLSLCGIHSLRCVCMHVRVACTRLTSELMFLYVPVRPEFCVLVCILRCDSCALSVSSAVSILYALCMYPCVLFISLRCVRALSLFVCYYSCALCVTCSHVSLCSMCSCIPCCDPMLCLSPMWYSFCALYVSMRAIYFNTMCACSISFRVILFLMLCGAYSCVFLCCIPYIPAYIL